MASVSPKLFDSVRWCSVGLPGAAGAAKARAKSDSAASDGAGCWTKVCAGRLVAHGLEGIFR